VVKIPFHSLSSVKLSYLLKSARSASLTYPWFSITLARQRPVLPIGREASPQGSHFLAWARGFKPRIKVSTLGEPALPLVFDWELAKCGLLG